MKHTERLIEEARKDIEDHPERRKAFGTTRNKKMVAESGLTHWCTRNYRVGYANWKHLKTVDGNPNWCDKMVTVTLKVFDDGKERKIFNINHFRANRKECEAVITELTTN